MEAERPEFTALHKQKTGRNWVTPTVTALALILSLVALSLTCYIGVRLVEIEEEQRLLNSIIQSLNSQVELVFIDSLAINNNLVCIQCSHYVNGFSLAVLLFENFYTGIFRQPLFIHVNNVKVKNKLISFLCLFQVYMLLLISYMYFYRQYQCINFLLYCMLYTIVKILVILLSFCKHIIALTSGICSFVQVYFLMLIPITTYIHVFLGSTSAFTQQKKCQQCS